MTEFIANIVAAYHTPTVIVASDPVAISAELQDIDHHKIGRKWFIVPAETASLLCLKQGPAIKRTMTLYEWARNYEHL